MTSTATDISRLLVNRFTLREKSYTHLQRSLEKTARFLDRSATTPEDRESIEACLSRFETVVEILLNQLTKSIELYETGTQEGVLRDRLALMHKLELIPNVEKVIGLRSIRNKLAHSHVDDEYVDILVLIHEYSSIYITPIYESISTYVNTVSK